MIVRSLLAIVALAGAASPAIAAAQTRPPADPAAQADEPPAGDIVVTAQKRTERLQDVPIAITVLSGATLSAAKIETGTEIARQTPNLRVSNLGDESQPKFALRGISTPEFNLNAISPTGVFTDEVYIGASFLGGAQLYDIERVEVLRGPQGTLYGKNTTAGAVNFITRQPTFRPEAEIRGGFGEYGYWQLRGTAEVPLIDDRLSFRVAFNREQSHGYIENVNPAGRDLSNINRFSGRATLAYKDDSGFRATARFFVVDDNPRAIGAVNEGTGAGGLNALGINPRRNPFTGAALTRRQVATDRSGDIEVRGTGGHLRPANDLAFARVTSTTSYQRGRFLNLVDGDGTIAPLLHIDFAAESKEYSQDLRLASNGGGALQWIAGVYAQGDKVDVSTVYLLFGGPPAFPVLTQTYGQKRRSYAAYADLTYDVTERLSLYGGIRYTKDRGRLYDFRVVPLILPQATLRYSDGQPTGRAGVRYKFTPDVMAYAQYARGYRSSAINGGALTNPADLNVARPEKLDSYEVGLKTQLFDQVLTLNTSAFFYDFRNQQFLNVVGVGNQQLVNAGKSRIKGLEVEAALQPLRDLRLAAGLGLLDAEYKRLTLNGANLAGNRMIEAPKATLNLSGDYTIPWGDHGGISLHGDATHVSSQYFSPTNLPIFRVGAFWDAAARIAVRDPSGRFELAAYGKNLTDNSKSTGIQVDPSTGTKFSTVPYPRRYGVELTARF